MMAKKRRRRRTSAKFKFSVEITGIIFILIGVIGLFDFGPIGHFFKNIGIFLNGSHFYIFMILLSILGIYMLIKGNVPNFFNRKLLGLYLLVISFLSLMNIRLLENGKSLSDSFKLFADNYLVVISDSAYTNISQTGGGAIGIFFSWLTTSFAGPVGSYVIYVIIGLIGLLLFIDIDFSDILDALSKMIKESREENKERRIAKKQARKEAKENASQGKIYDQTEEDEEEFDPNKIVIKSTEELKHKQEELPKVEEEPPVLQVPTISINSNYQLPKLDEVLNKLKKEKKTNSDDFIKNTTLALQRVLADFQIIGKVVAVHEGPSVTQFELQIKNGTKMSKISGLSKEIALALAAKDVRIEAPIPGKSTVGIEIPNAEPVGVPIREVIEVKRREMEGMNLPVSLGKDIYGNNQICDLSKTPHLLVAGSTGSGKSVCINSFIASLLITKKPDEVKLILVDPKKVELSNYNGIPHLLCPVVSDPKKASIALQNVVKEMEHRYDMFADEKVKNITGYNELMSSRKKKNPEDESIQLMPYMVVIIDELADLMLVASKEVEDSIMRITQMARAAGIHLIVATQRPSTDVITGVVKANIPSRISFAVASQIDSRTILDSSGAEKLLGKGDMLYKPMGQNVAIRIQGNFISDDEIERVIKYVSKQQAAQYDESITVAKGSSDSASGSTGGGGASDDEDPLMNEIIDFAVESGKISASLVQRRFRLGYNRAARIIDELEARGIIGPQNGSKPREVLVKVQGEE
jgi:S-DNA-T family DNA segregation ATPase FtsK/SpoIIIE